MKYHSGYHKFLNQQYTRINEPERYYDPRKKVVMVCIQTPIDEDVTQTTLEEFSYEDFIRERFEEETEISKHFIKETYNNFHI